MTGSGGSSHAPVVEVWRISLHARLASVRDCLNLLDLAERQRAARFARDDDRLRFLIGRATLRLLLGRRLGIAPRQVVFGFNRFGKPLLPAAPALHFNLSHAGSWIVLALSTTTPVGIDVEVLQTDAGLDALGSGALTPAEQRWLASFDAGRRGEAFTRLWVCKEAYVKALGEGLSRSFEQICIGEADGETPVILHDHNDGETGVACHLRRFSLPNHAGCLACLGERPQIHWHGQVPPG